MNREVNQHLKRIILSLDEAAGAFRVMSASDRREVGIGDATAGVMRYTGARPKGVEITFEPGDEENSRHMELYTHGGEHGWSVEVDDGFGEADAAKAAAELVAYLQTQVNPQHPDRGIQMRRADFKVGQLKWLSNF